MANVDEPAFLVKLWRKVQTEKTEETFLPMNSEFIFVIVKYLSTSVLVYHQRRHVCAIYCRDKLVILCVSAPLIIATKFIKFILNRLLSTKNILTQDVAYSDPDVC